MIVLDAIALGTTVLMLVLGGLGLFVAPRQHDRAELLERVAGSEGEHAARPRRDIDAACPRPILDDAPTVARERLESALIETTGPTARGGLGRGPFVSLVVRCLGRAG